MYFNQFADFYKNLTGYSITREEFNKQISITIQKIEKALEISDYLKKITIKVIESRIFYMNTGQQKHGITKQDYKNAIDVMAKIAEKDIQDEKQKLFFKCLIEALKKSIDNS